MMEDTLRSSKSISIIASDKAPQNLEAWQVLERAAVKRGAQGGSGRIVFHDDAEKWPHVREYGQKSLEVRLWGAQPLSGELILYGSKIALIVYEPSLIVTVITNETLAQTFQSIFEQIWSDAKI